jgi:O-antigen/teichoic acid export membrane protein
VFTHLLRLSKHSIIYGLGVVVSQVIGFFLIPLYTRYLTPAGYGTLEIFNTTLTVLGVIFVMGLSTAIFRSYYLHDDENKKKTVVSTAYLFLTATSALLTLLLISVAGSFSSLFFHSSEYAFYFRIIFLTLFCNTGIMIGLSVFRAREEPARYIMVTIAQVMLSLGLNITFVIALHKGVLGILEGNLITAASVYLVLLASIIRRAGFGFSSEELKRMLAFGLPLVPSGLSMWVLTLSDRYFLQFLSTPTELGLYSLGYKFGLVISGLLVGPLQLAFLPFTFSIAKEKNAREVYSRVFTYFMLIAVFAALVLSVLSREVLAIMATPAFHNAYKVIPLIALSYVLYGCYFVLMVGINLHAKTKYLAVFVVAAAILNLGLNYALIPHYGMMGAAVATLISYVSLPISSYLLSQRYYSVKYEWGRVAKICIAFGVIFAGSLFIPHQSGVVTGVYKLLTIFAYPILLYILGFYHHEEIQKTKQIFKTVVSYSKRRFIKGQELP